MYYFCTYFDRNYLDKGLALYYSLLTHCQPFNLWILCLDDICHKVLHKMNLSCVTLITLPEFENGDVSLQEAKKNRTLVEYYFTCTPSLPLFILNNFSFVDIITYLDSDLYFFSSIKPIFEEFNENSVLIIGHRFPPKFQDREKYGKYNVGLLTIRRDTNGLNCLLWWRERCLEWCYDRVEDNRFGDQKYLDRWPELFSGVVVLKHPGAGLAPWNIENYQFTIGGNQIMVDSQPVIFYHFQGLNYLGMGIFDINLLEYEGGDIKMIKNYIYIPYTKKIFYFKSELTSKFYFKSNVFITIRKNEDYANKWNKYFSVVSTSFSRIIRIIQKFFKGHIIIYITHLEHNQ